MYIKEDRKNLLVFLRGKKVEKTELKRTKPGEISILGSMWGLCKRHIEQNRPSEYVFALKVCYKATCCHLICQKRKPADELV